MKLGNFTYSLSLLLFLLPLFSSAQRGKEGNYTASGTGTIVNTYTWLTANAAVNASTITVNNASMSGGAFSGNLAAGDLLLIIQMQGATMDIETYPATNGWGDYTVPAAYLWSFDWNQHPDAWGTVTALNQAGKFEQVEVRSVAGNVITLQCNLQNSYTASGHVQVVRVPRFNDLTLSAGATIIPTQWDGNSGGIVAIEVNGNITFNTGSKISASTRGFRGGALDATGKVGSNTPNTDGPGNGSTYLGSNTAAEGSEKGEGIGGSVTEYTALFSRYGRGAPANGGGGAGYQNSGGGGGANVAAAGTYTGKGVPSTTYSATAWNLEMAGFAGSSSPGGGRGGYSYSTSDQNATLVGPNSGLWQGDARKVNGGLGGHPLAYDATRLFMGGGGGAGDQDSGQGGAGGNGGGIVFVTCYGTISGTGTIESDGAVGQNTNPNNQTVSTTIPSTNNKKGNDGAGGGGAGGSIYIKNSTALPNTVTLSAKGGNGGNHALLVGIGAVHEGGGPGGAGSGGSIAFTTGAPVQTVAGGASGTSTSNHLTEFIPNGATGGSAGLSSLPTTIFNITANNATICSGNTATVSVTVTGTLPGTLTWYTTPFGTTQVPGSSGLTTITTPVLTSTTTYYVGVCPGTFRVPVTITVNPTPVISGTPVLTNPTCSAPGSITGLTVSGGTTPYTYAWNGNATPGIDYTNIPAGTYTLVVTSANGCSATSGPYTLSGTSGPIINASGVAVTNQSCNGTMGSITGITATGTSLSYSWSNSGGTSLNASGLSAGNYTLTVTDGNGCTATSGPYTVGFTAGPSINAAGVVITASTCGNANGSITGITATGTGLTYSWNGNASASTSISGQNGGNYTLTVTDVNGCTATSGPHTIPAIAGPTLNTTSVVVSDEICNQGNGSITGITVSGGTPSYTISWTNTAQATLNISSLQSGTYNLTVTDQNGCTATAGPYNVADAGGPVVNTTAVNVTPEYCNGTMGTITGITATGTGLNYIWTNGGGSSLSASGLAAGTYSLTVTDVNSCSVTVGPYTVNYIAGPTVNSAAVSITPSTCGLPNGSITGIVATGTGLSYSWNSNSTPDEDLTAQLGGSYTLTVTDVNGCTATSGPHVIPSITGPSLNTAGVTTEDEHCGQANGTISGILINGGTPTYSIAWTNTAQTTLDLTNLPAGNYSLTVTDQNGCTATAGPYTINNLSGPVLNETSAVATDVLCDGTLGTITGITSTGSNLTYSWSNGGGSSLNASGLLPGVYTLTVTDAYGCTDVSNPYTIDAMVPLVIDNSGVIVTPTACTSGTGSISGVVVLGGVNPTYSWSNGATTLNISNLTSGTYTLTVTDDQGCNETLPVTVDVNNPPVIDASSALVADAHCSQSSGSISGVTVSGGTPGYTYSWNNDPLLNTLDIASVPSGNYTLTVTDSQGCTDTESITVNEAGAPVINSASVVLVQPSCTAPGEINGLNVTGSGPFTYSWDNTTQTTLDISGLTAGVYNLTVTDAFGCTSDAGPFVLVQPVGPTADFTWAPDAPGPGEDIVFTNTSSGMFITDYTWTIDGQSFSVEDIMYHFDAEGTYPITLVVIDMNGCTDSITQQVKIYGELVIPNVITVNGDGANDKWEIKNLKPDSKLVIINRWGNVVVETDNYLNDWDGKDRSGQDLLEGVYTYKLTGPDDKVYHGFVHLVR